METWYDDIPSTLISTALQPGWMSCMNVEVEIEPIQESGSMARDWNGVLKNLGNPLFRLYRIRLSCSDDMLPPVLGGLWPGTEFSMVPPTFLAGVDGGRTPYGASRVLPDGRVYRRYEFPELVVTEPWRITHTELQATHRWELVAEEKRHPSLIPPPEPEE